MGLLMGVLPMLQGLFMPQANQYYGEPDSPMNPFGGF
jgi:hypothetical protein